MFKIIVFDLEGVLTSNVSIFHLLKQATGYKGTVRSLHARLYNDYVVLTSGGMKENVFWKIVKDKTGSRRHVENIRRSFLKAFKKNFDRKLFDEASVYFSFALCSNFHHSWWNDLKTKLGISFDYELVSSSIKIRKPAAQVYLKIAEFFKTVPEECVYVGEETEDVMGAKQAGMKTVLISSKLKSFEYADYVYPNVDKFMEALV